MKNRIIVGALILVIILVPIIFLCFAFALAPQYDDSFYGGMAIKYERLNNIEGRKIVIIGGSSVAFGVRSDILEHETGIPVVNFGLYANLGTKYMLDVAQDSIGPDDIVIVAPEQNSQALSNYFNGEAVWYSVDGNYNILTKIDNKNAKDLAGGFLKFVSSKFGYWQSKEKPCPDGVYNVKSFDEYGDIKYDRPYNVMTNSYDSGMAISFDSEVISSDFIDYLNDYAKKIRKKGASIYYSFCPMNKLALSEDVNDERIMEYYDILHQSLKMDILGNPKKRILESEWFYDSNFHLNDSGAIYYTAKLAQDIKSVLGDYSPIKTQIPQMPQKPANDNVSSEGVDKELEEVTKIFKLSGVEIILEGGEVKYKGEWHIDGLTEYGLTLEEITIPDAIFNLPVTSIRDNCFEGNLTLKRIIFGENISSLGRDAVRGCDNLTGIYITSHDPSKFHPYIEMLDGLSNCAFYIPQADYSKFMNDYFWGFIDSDKIKIY